MPQPKKVHVIQDFPKPTTVVKLQRFLGMINFYRRSIPKAAKAQMPLMQYTTNSKKNDRTPIEWTPEAEEAFDKCKKKG